MKSVHKIITNKINPIFRKTWIINSRKINDSVTVSEITRIKQKIYRHVANSTLTDPKDLV
jgi:hypothetical protein